MNRGDVFTLIAGERDYQDGLHNHSHEQDASTSVAARLIYIEKHLSSAKESIYYLDQQKALEEIRKLAALAVACMEHNETKSRK